MLAALKVEQLKRLPDERGFFSEVLRNDWKDIFGDDTVAQSNFFKAVGDEPAMLAYFTTNLYDPSNPDEERRVWNDPTLIPKSVNGKKGDTRVGKSWDWNYPPYK